MVTFLGKLFLLGGKFITPKSYGMGLKVVDMLSFSMYGPLAQLRQDKIPKGGGGVADLGFFPGFFPASVIAYCTPKRRVNAVEAHLILFVRHLLSRVDVDPPGSRPLIRLIRRAPLPCITILRSKHHLEPPSNGIKWLLLRPSPARVIPEQFARGSTTKLG